MSWTFSSSSSDHTSKPPLSTISSPSLDEERLVEIEIGSRSENVLSNSWTGSQFSAGADDGAPGVSVRRRPSILQAQPVTRASDDIVETMLNNASEGDLVSEVRFGTKQRRQRTQNQNLESNQDLPRPSPSSPHRYYWRIFGPRNICKRFFRSRVAVDCKRIEWICVSIDKNPPCS
jgi:hypothetical protein